MEASRRISLDETVYRLEDVLIKPHNRVVLRISQEKQHEDREQDLRGSSRALIVELSSFIEKVVEEQVVDDDWQVSNETSTKAKSSCRSSTQSDKSRLVTAPVVALPIVYPSWLQVVGT